MYLDLRTLGVVALVICMLLGPVSLAFGLRHKVPAALHWGGALLLLALGLALQAVRIGSSDLVAHGFVYAFFAGGALLAEQAARALASRSPRDIHGFAAATLLVMVMLGWNDPAYEVIRTYAGDGVLAVLLFRAARGFDHASLPQDAESARATAAVAGLVGMGLLLDAAATATGLRRGDELVPAVLDAGLMVGFVTALVAATLAMMWTLSARLGQALRQVSTRDTLTGLLNRGAFMRAHGRELARTRRRSDSHYALVLFDVDHLGRINEACGHAAGDRTLRAIAQPLSSLLREYDFAGRLDGDEFALLLPGTLVDGARITADRIRKAVQRAAGAAAGVRLPITLSAAVAVHGADGEDWDALMASARSAMRAAKAAGRNRTVAASDSAPVPARDVAAVEPKDPLAPLRELVDAPRPVSG